MWNVPKSDTRGLFLPFGHPETLEMLDTWFYLDYFGLVVPSFYGEMRNTFWLHNVTSNWKSLVPI